MKALVLAGGFPQIALIKELKRRNITVLLADYYEKALARSHADQFFNVSTLDVDAIANLARTENVNFLITACTDQALLTVAKVSQLLKLPCYINYETALNVTNKAYMKKVFVENGIPTARHVIMDMLQKQNLRGFEYPLIVKPVDCNSSKGVAKVTCWMELETAFEIAKKCSRTGKVIVEEFIEGDEVSVDVYVENGKANVLCVSNSAKIASNEKFVIYRALYPAKNAIKLHSVIQNIAQRIAEAFELVDSPMLIQMISDGSRISVVEFSARTGGGVKYLLIKRVSGFDVIKAVVDLTLGIKPHCVMCQPIAKYMINDFIYCDSGKFDHLAGFDMLKSDGTMFDYYTFKWKGADFHSINSSGDRVAGYTVVGETVNEIQEKHGKISSNIQVISIEGYDMMRHDLIPPVSYENF